MIFTMKYIISTALMIENPVRSPIVPPMAESMSTGLADLSIVTLSNTGVSNFIWINLRFSLFNSKPRDREMIIYLGVNKT